MKALVFSDLHFFSTPSELPRFKDRLDYQWATCDWFAQEIRARKPDLVVNLGDSAHRHASISMAALQTFGQSMRSVADACRDVDAQFFIVAGNHDQSTKDGSVTFVDGLLPAYERVALVAHEAKTWRDGNYSVGLIPYTHDLQLFQERRAQLGRLDLLFIHQDVKQVLWAPGRPADHGLDFEQVRTDGWTICGHYHHPQLFQSQRFAVVGSPFYASWSDSLMVLPRGYLWVDSPQAAPTWEANPFTPIRHTIHVTKSAEAVTWVEALKGAEEHSRVMLRVLCPSEKVAQNVERKLAGSGLLKLLVRGARSEERPALESALVMDQPEQAVRDLAAKVVQTDQEVAKLATSEELAQFGLEALRANATSAAV